MRAWIDRWEPDDERFWESTGRRVARRNLVFSIFAEFLGFTIWVLWAVVATKLNDNGFDFSTSQLFWLVALPGLVGATMRFPYTFMPARVGGRNWTVVSALLLLIPTVLLAVMVSDPATPYALMRRASAAATSRRAWPTSPTSTRMARRGWRSGSTPPAATWEWPSRCWWCRS
jgi:NNP family nitrate/nitrite transporter-like MFS transporter